MQIGMDQVYLFCFALGLIFAVVSGILSGLFGGHGGHAAVPGGHDIDVNSPTHIDVAGHADSGAVHFSPLSPVTICMFITAFGGVGLIGKQLLQLDLPAHLALAGLSGFVVAGATFFLFNALFKVTQGSSVPGQLEVLGIDAEVTTAIPRDGIGEIAYVLRGSRYTAPARGLTGEPHAARQVVVVRKVVGGTFLVEPPERSAR